MEIKINSIDDIIENLENDLITFDIAIQITCKALKMIHITFGNDTKETVLEYLKELKQFKNETPLFWGVLDLDLNNFSVKQLIKK
jgi:hypothetical protein